MEISDKLSAFIENEYKSMVSYEKRKQKEKQSHGRKKEARKKELARLLKKGLINDLEVKYEKLKYRIGKTYHTFNNFVYLCWYLIKNETQAQEDSDVHLWISNFLTENNFRKPITRKPSRSRKSKKHDQYTENDIKGIVYDQECGEGSSAKSLKSYFDFQFDEFNNPQTDRVYEKPSTWEYDLPLTWKELLKKSRNR